MNFGEQLKKLREEYGKTQREMAKVLDMTQGSYAQRELKENNATVELLLKLSKTYDLPIDFILSEEAKSDNMIGFINRFNQLHGDQKETISDFTQFLVEENERKKSDKAADNTIELYRREELTKVEVFDEALSAGFGNGLNGNQETYPVYTDILLSRYQHAARIKGDSMEPKIPDESIVTFLDGGFDKDGGIYVVSQGDEGQETLYCKQVFLDDERYRCHSLNPHPQYADFFLDEEDTRIIGRVVDWFEPIYPDQVTD